MNATTVQFLVERPCPELGLDHTANTKALAELPAAIWVWFPAEVNRSYRCSSPKVYRVTTESAEEFRGKIGRERNGSECVCEHMGHVIE